MKYDIAIVGGGPAGMTAALYAARAGKRVVLFEGEMLGGQILPTRKIENYPALPEVDGYTFADGLTTQIETLGVAIVYAAVTKIEKAESDPLVGSLSASCVVGRETEEGSPNRVG